MRYNIRLVIVSAATTAAIAVPSAGFAAPWGDFPGPEITPPKFQIPLPEPTPPTGPTLEIVPGYTLPIEPIDPGPKLPEAVLPEPTDPTPDPGPATPEPAPEPEPEPTEPEVPADPSETPAQQPADPGAPSDEPAGTTPAPTGGVPKSSAPSKPTGGSKLPESEDPGTAPSDESAEDGDFALVLTDPSRNDADDQDAGALLIAEASDSSLSSEGSSLLVPLMGIGLLALLIGAGAALGLERRGYLKRYRY